MLKFNSKPIAEHEEVPLADEGRFETLVEHWQQRTSPPAAAADQPVACYVVSVGAARDPELRDAQLGEILSLVESQGGQIVGQEICYLSEPNPRTLLGKGRAEEIAQRARASGATLLVLDAELSPSQARNLEDTAGMAICDREAIILNVFLRHARTRRARIQVELAQLEYLRPRIRGIGLDMDQQTGGLARARGPGETASELMARKLDRRLEQLKKALARLQLGDVTQRRQRASCRRIVLVGYTNAGKTSLMNALTAAQLSARDRPFETLDTTSRCLTRHGGEVLISDTVGFIRRLPDRLLGSFESTLAEIGEASLLVIVVDVADRERDLHLQTTLALLDRLGAAQLPRYYVFNKLDRLRSRPNPAQLACWSGGHPYAVLSSTDAAAVATLERELLQAVRGEQPELALCVPYAANEVLSLIYARCRVSSSVATDVGLELRVHGPAEVLAQIRSRLEVRS